MSADLYSICSAYADFALSPCAELIIQDYMSPAKTKMVRITSERFGLQQMTDMKILLLLPFHDFPFSPALWLAGPFFFKFTRFACTRGTFPAGFLTLWPPFFRFLPAPLSSSSGNSTTPS